MYGPVTVVSVDGLVLFSQIYFTYIILFRNGIHAFTSSLC